MKSQVRILVFVLVIISSGWLCAQRNMPKLVSGDAIAIGAKMTIESSVFKQKRDILLSLPAGYEKSVDRYPVIYFTDGSLVKLRLFRGMIDFLASENRMPNAILVGIVPVNRDAELLPANPSPEAAGQPDQGPHGHRVYGNADQLAQFMQQELFPAIEAQYRTLQSRIFVGHSFGGVFGLYCMQKYPGMFNGQIAIDPSLWWENGILVDWLAAVLQKNPQFSQSLFVSKSVVMRAGEQFVRLNKIMHDNAFAQFKYGFLELPASEDHNSAVLPTMVNGLQKIFAEFVIADYGPLTFEGFKSFYAKPVLGVIYPLMEAMVNSFGYKKMGPQSGAEALKAFQYNVAQHPDSANAYDSLADGYEAAGKLQDALASCEKAIELGKERHDLNLAFYVAHRDRVQEQLKKN